MLFVCDKENFNQESLDTEGQRRTKMAKKGRIFFMMEKERIDL